MAEVATNVLHNVGNVLNSVNVSAEAVAGKVRQFRITNLKSVADLLREHSHDLPEFLSRDPRGMKLPDYLTKLADHLAEPQKAILEEVNSLRDNIEHIKGIVAMQQTHARRSGVLENLSAVDLMEDAIRINSAAFMRHAVNLEREFEDVPTLLTDRHLVLQILVNLLSNAKYALDNVACERRMVLRISSLGNDEVKFTVSDNGVGIEQENLTRIFQHGFTTKRDGHGFGLHSGALAARALGGKLTAHSDGLGKGSIFTLELPLSPPLTALS
jgi:signal transduction histidine kinase